MNISAAMQSLDKAVILSRSCGAKRQEAEAVIYIANIERRTGHYTAAHIHAQEAQKLAQWSGDLYEEARALHIDADCHRELGQLKTSITLYHRARKLLELCGMSGGGLDYVLMNGEAEVYLQKSEYAKAHSLYTQIIQNTSADQDPHNYASGLLNVAEIGVLIGENKHKVYQNLDKAKTILNALPLSVALHYCDMTLASMHLREGETLIAKIMFQKSLYAFWGSTSEGVLYNLAKLGDLNKWPSSDFVWVSRYTVVFLAYSGVHQHKLALYQAVQFLGDVFLAQGDQSTASSLFIVALEGFTFMDIHRSRAECMLHLGDISKHRGDLVKAVELWKEAQILFERSLQSNSLAQINKRLAAVGQDVLNAPNSSLLKLKDLNVPGRFEEVVVEDGHSIKIGKLDDEDQEGVLGSSVPT